MLKIYIFYKQYNKLGISNRYMKTFSYIVFGPLLILTSSVWFTTDYLGLVLSYFYYYYSAFILASFIFLYWLYFSKGELRITKKIPFFQLSFFTIGVILGLFDHIILSLSLFLSIAFFLYSKKEGYKLDLYSSDFIFIKNLNLILCICFIFMIVFLCNPYTKPYLN